MEADDRNASSADRHGRDRSAGPMRGRHWRPAFSVLVASSLFAAVEFHRLMIGQDLARSW